MRDALLAHPLQGAVAAVVDVNDDLVGISRILPDAAYAQLQQRDIIPGGDQDGEHGRSARCMGLRSRIRIFCPVLRVDFWFKYSRSFR
jgi:hypothetical protein